MPVALIVDIIGSRLMADREAAQRALDAAVAEVGSDLPVAVAALLPTVGDELQGVYPSLNTAMATTLLIQLTLPDIVECRFGLGIGEAGEIPSATGDIAEGSAWWAARPAIDHVHEMQQRAVPSMRTWVMADAGEDRSVQDAVRSANAYLLARDQVVGQMSERARRLTRGRCFGVTQRELAEQEGISQAAVSQILAAAGAASVVGGYRLLAD